MDDRADAFLGHRSWRWLAAPPVDDWTAAGDALTWRCAAGTDFWRVTQGHPTKHDGQAFVISVDGDFALEATFEARLATQFDQTGLFVERDEETWLKAGVELDGPSWLSAVHTRGASDWSREPGVELPLRLRVEREADAISASALVGDGWQTFRVLTLAGPVNVGLYSCSPLGGGFETRATAVVLESPAE